MFVDASALVALLTNEPDATRISEELESANRPVTSAIAVFETVVAVVRKSGLARERVANRVDAFLQRASIRVLEIDEETGQLALAAHAHYGKGSGHPARLNLGDCFAYAMAKQHRVPLLYKGDDFVRTDLA